MPETQHRPQRPLTRLTVVRREEPCPSVVRVVFTSDDFTYGGFTDSYLKFLFDESGPVLDHVPERPTTRTYTVRRHDADTGEITVDFVIHGSAGLAAPWALTCRPGDQLLARGPGGKWSPPSDADFHLFVGDESSTPAIAAALERLADDARGLAIIETHADVQELVAPDGVEVRWLVRGEDPYREERLADEVAALDWASLGDVSVFAHGERGAVKALRTVLRERVPRERLSISGYWALGRIEDEFQAEKKLPEHKF